MLNDTPYNFVQVTCNHKSYGECWIAYYVWRTVPFILIIVGTCGNLLNFVVLLRKRMRKYSTSVYLLFLAGSDLVVLWTGTVLDTNEYFNRVRVSDMAAFTCKTVRFLSMTSGGFSIWLLVLLTSERVILTKLTPHANHKMTPRCATFASTITLIVVIIFTSHLLFGFRLVETVTPSHMNSTQPVKVLVCTYSSKKYEIFFSETWGLLILIFLNVIPVLIIIFGNLTIVVTLLQQRNKLRRVHPVSSVAESRHAQQRKSPTRILFVISGVFLVTTLPYSSYVIVKSGLEDLDEHTFAKHQLINSIIMMLLYSNFTFNFFLYFVSGTLFKKEWQQIVSEVNGNVRGLLQRTRHETDLVQMQHIT